MTKRTASTMRVRQPLTDLENEVMQAVWDGGTCTVEAVHRIVSRKRNLKEATVRTLLRRLEQKGYLRHESDCRASVEELVSGMVEAKVLKKDDIEELERFVRGRR